jgi:hypothetical protein
MFQKEFNLKASAMNQETSLEYSNVKVETQLRSNTVFGYDCNIVTARTLERHANHQDHVSLERREARRVSCLPDPEMRISTAL